MIPPTHQQRRRDRRHNDRFSDFGPEDLAPVPRTMWSIATKTRVRRALAVLNSWASGNHTMIPPELFEYLESGISVLVGTRDDRLFPDGCRAIGARVEDEGRGLTVFLPEATSVGVRANLQDNRRIAVGFCRPRDHRSIQIKGTVIELRPAEEADRETIDRYRRELVEEWGWVGIPPHVTERTAHRPCWAARLRVESIYLQTPGPGAGAPLGPGGGGGNP